MHDRPIASTVIRPFADPEYNIGWWIDDAGSFHAYRPAANDQPPTAGRGGADPFTPGRNALLAMRQYGMVRLERIRGGLRLEFDLCTVERTALEAAAGAVRSGGLAGRVVLTFRYGGWVREEFAAREDALDRLALLEGYIGETPKPVIACAGHTLADLVSAKPLLRQAHARWQAATDGGLEMFESPFRAVAPYSLNLAEGGGVGTLFYRSVGRRSHIVSYLGQDWARGVIGTLSTHGHSDVEFENVISEPYFESLRTGVPHYGHVRALFAADEQEPEWVSYQRLVLPYEAANGQKALAIVVAPDQDVSIPFLTGTD
jgi:hypothetical protein